MTPPAARTGLLVRFVLLACTLVGLAAMHSLGHDPVMSMRSAAGHADHAAGQPAPPAAHGCGSDSCDHPSASPLGHGTGHLPGWQVCLALVAAVGLAVALGVLLLARTSHARLRQRPRRRAASSRAPPAPRIGLHLASVSVLRV
ncbi:DUF6153 family protein [Micromonospora sp. NPDC005324]|uniref:DUF6153 family protein n=1 Tax=Micromonospora sp. NPDC005324 TaxID=3157033 RepID=UPI0033A377A7